MRNGLKSIDPFSVSLLERTSLFEVAVRPHIP